MQSPAPGVSGVDQEIARQRPLYVEIPLLGIRGRAATIHSRDRLPEQRRQSEAAACSPLKALRERIREIVDGCDVVDSANKGCLRLEPADWHGAAVIPTARDGRIENPVAASENGFRVERMSDAEARRETFSVGIALAARQSV